MTSVSSPEIYPQYCFNLSPTITKWCPLTSSDVHALRAQPGFEGQDLFFHKNHPIKWVRIAGVVVAIDEYSGRQVITVDDSSGVNIECVIKLVESSSTGTEAGKTSIASADRTQAQHRVSAEREARSKETAALVAKNIPQSRPQNVCAVDIGFVVDVKGGIRLFREQKQIIVDRMVRLRSTEEEVRFWEKVRELRESVLGKPWVLSEKQVRRCRREAEGRGGPSRKRAKAALPTVPKNAVETKRSKEAPAGLPHRVAKQAKETGLERRSRKARAGTLPKEGPKYDALGI